MRDGQSGFRSKVSGEKKIEAFLDSKRSWTTDGKRKINDLRRRKCDGSQEVSFGTQGSLNS